MHLSIRFVSRLSFSSDDQIYVLRDKNQRSE